MNITNNLSFADLVAMKKILEEELEVKKKWVESHNTDFNHTRWRMAVDTLATDDIHQKLELINNRIKEIIQQCFY